MNILNTIKSDSRIISVLQEAVVLSLRGYANAEVVSAPAFFKAETNLGDYKLVGLIRLSSEDHEAVLALAFSESMFFKLYENIFHEKPTAVTGENQDLVGEIANIVFQTADPNLRKLGIKFSPSLPEVLTGQKLEDWKVLATGNSLVLPFAIGNEQFCFDLIEMKEG